MIGSLSGRSLRNIFDLENKAMDLLLGMWDMYIMFIFGRGKIISQDYEYVENEKNLDSMLILTIGE